MQTNRIIAFLLLCIFSSCASSNRSTGLLQMDENGLPETVMILDDPIDQEQVILFVQRIEARRKIVALVEQSHSSVSLLYSAGRASQADMAASGAKLDEAKINVLDAQIALVRTGLIDASNSTILDTDGDGLPDQIEPPLSMESLLKEKLSLRAKQFENAEQSHAHSENLKKTGRVGEEGLLDAAQAMFAAKALWIDAKLELRAWQAEAAAR